MLCGTLPTLVHVCIYWGLVYIQIAIGFLAFVVPFVL